MLRIFVLAFLVVSVSASTHAQPTQVSNPLILGYIIDINALGAARSATSLAVDTITGNIYVSVARTGFVELSPSGEQLNVFTLPTVQIDNSGLSYDARTGNLWFINGLGRVSPEPIFEVTKLGVIVNQFASLVDEGMALAVDPVSSHLFVVDYRFSSGQSIVRELRVEGTQSVEVQSYMLPTVLGGDGDAAMEFNPLTGNIAISGEFGPNRGVIYDVSRDGTSVQPYFDTKIETGITGMAFSNDPFRMYVLDGAGERILVYGDFEKVYLPYIVRSR